MVVVVVVVVGVGVVVVVVVVAKSSFDHSRVRSSKFGRDDDGTHLKLDVGGRGKLFLVIVDQSQHIVHRAAPPAYDLVAATKALRG